MSAARISWWVPVSLAPLLAAAVAVREHPSTALPEPSAAVELERVFPRLRFERPVLVTGAQDGTDRLFVVEQDGVIRVFDQEDDPAESRVFLDLRAKVCRKFNEEGLLGLAFHPDYRENGLFFVHYSSADPDEVGVVARFQVDPEDPDRADPASEQVVLTQPQPWRNHNGGMIAFGPDGYLYISFGDGGSGGDPQGNGQDPSNWMGSILRIDVDAEGAPYEVPADKFLYGKGGEASTKSHSRPLRYLSRPGFGRFGRPPTRFRSLRFRSVSVSAGFGTSVGGLPPPKPPAWGAAAPHTPREL